MIATTSTPQSSRHTGQPSSPLSQPPSPLSSSKSLASPRLFITMTMTSRTIQPQWTSVKTVLTERTSAAKMPLSLQRQKLFWSLHQIISLESRSLHISLSGPEAPLSKFLLSLPEENLSQLAFVWGKICQIFFVTTWKYFWQGIQSGGCRMHTSGVVRTFINHRILKHFSNFVSRFSN